MARTPKARALGAALRREREQRGLTTRDLAERVGRNHGEISRWETGDRTARPEHVAQILTALGIVGEPYDDVLSLAYDTDAPLWVATTLPKQRRQLAAFVDLEQSSRSIIEVTPLLVPGLLQTIDYARAVMSDGSLLPPEEVVTRVAVRMGRRDVITRLDPAQLTAFIGEGALHQVIGSPSVLLAQLRHLLAITERPNITMRVIPFNSGWNPALESGFSFITPGNSIPIVSVELRNTVLFLYEEDDVALYQEAIGLIADVALSPEISVQLIKRIIAEKERQE